MKLPKLMKKLALALDAENWITMNGARVLVESNGMGDYTVKGGAGGKMTGKTVSPKSMSENRINQKTSQFNNPDFKPHEGKSEKPKASNVATNFIKEGAKKEMEGGLKFSNVDKKSASNFGKSLKKLSKTPTALKSMAEHAKHANQRESFSFRGMMKSSDLDSYVAGGILKEDKSKSDGWHYSFTEEGRALTLEVARKLKPQAQDHTLALDRNSVRNYSEDGHLHVETSHISKAMVCPYYGREIPDCEGLGLDPSEVYYLLRDPDELEKSADSFKGKPILLRHTPVSSDDHPHEITVGSIGDNVSWNTPYLDASLHIWDDKAIAGIESKNQTELSCGYHYDADMTAGEYDGVKYDGIMRNIRGNHLALVDVGRAGSDVVVGDSNPFINNEVKPMKKSQRFKALMQKFITAKRSGMAMDADIEEIQDVLEAVQPLLEQVEDKLDDVSDEVDGDDVTEDDDDIRTLDEIPDDERDEWEEIPDREGYYRRKVVATDEDIDDDKKDDDKKSMGMDAATVQRKINQAVKQATAQARAEARALETAKDKVRPLVGNVMGMDSAADVYRFALKEKGISTKGIHPSAFPALVDMALRQGMPKRTIAQDSASTNTPSPEVAKLLGNIKVTG